MRIIIIPLSYQTTIVNTASERIRCDWLLPYLPADKFNGSQNLNFYDVLIYQKAYKPAIAEWGRKNNKIQIVDLTDPIWLCNPINKLETMYQHIDAFIFSTNELRVQFNVFFPQHKNKSFTVIDRLKLNEINERKVHEYKDPPTLVWFGYYDNFIRLSELLPYIDENKYPLITICERPVGYGKFIKWNNDTINKDIIRGDIALNPLNPQYLKTSLNKTMLANMLGLPVAESVNDITFFSELSNRIKYRKIKERMIITQYDIRISAKEISKIIYNIKNDKNEVIYGVKHEI